MNSRGAMSTTVEVLGLGNSLVDILAYADDDYLSAQEMLKGAMNLIDEDRAEALLRRPRRSPRDLRWVGRQHDRRRRLVRRAGGLYRQGQARPARRGIRRRHPLDRRRLRDRSRRAWAGNRTLFHLCHARWRADDEHLSGASSYLAPPDVDEALVKAAKVVYLEGYMWDRPAAKTAFQKAGEIARAAGRRVALTLSDSFCVDRFRGEFIDLMRSKTVDTIFANTDEILSLYETPHFDEALDDLRAEGVLGIVTRSEKGCVVVDGDRTWEVPAFPIAKLIDTTGAGDMFAAGFLAGLARERDMITCGRLGALAAAEIIQHLGARPNVSLVDLARENGLTV